MYNQRCFDIIHTILLFIGIFKDVQPINITSVNIPRLASLGTRNPVILDCDYDIGKSKNTGLVIKWYVNQELLYQWIYGYEPKGSDEFRKYIDETYKASDDPNEMYRAVKLVRLGHELTGNVRCLISTQFDGEAEASSQMLVYSPESVFRLSHPVLNEESNLLTVTCLAEDLYPLPTIKLRRNRQLIEVQKQYYKNHSDGRYSIEAVGILPMSEVQLPEIFRCELTIKDANYTSTREYLYNGGAAIVQLPRSFVIFAFVLAITMISSLITITHTI
ncbi:uncharacterized protein [Venturia canescens]|uniref:uncharacterized protein n=1 Tax=Venturia canescens TaxID=32260 RepID=UPI001C9D2411|nr:uncharacterized protein LOC122413519 [Venturia canescens]